MSNSKIPFEACCVERNSNTSEEESKSAIPMKQIEVGYLYLPRCSMYLLPSNLRNNSRCSIEPGTSMNVDLKLVQGDNSKSHISGDAEAMCSRCHLVINTLYDHIDEPENASTQQHSYSQNTLPRLELPCYAASRFDGTVNDLRHQACHCSSSRKRSDAALMLGLALSCQDLGHVSIQTVRIIVLPDDDETYINVNKQQQDHLRETTETKHSKDDNKSRYTRYHASLIITFAIPQLIGSCTPQGQRSIQSLGKPQRRMLSRGFKSLPASTQLLLSIMRSDWETLDKAMHHDYRKNHSYRSVSGNTANKRSVHSFFPSKLSLEEVYNRINGASTFLATSLDSICANSQHLFITSRQDEHGRIERMIDCNLLNLPPDVLVTNIAPHLRARSLDALRCSCRYLHHILRKVIPGLRLRLYKHQVDSLCWMRLRETRRLVESDLITHKTGSQCLGNCHNGDAHRAVTGGASVLLSPRYHAQDEGGGKTPSGDLRISQYTGDEVHVKKKDPLERDVARGGLLCDDPGLGKTITVLSLVLQTLGLSTMSPRPSTSPSKERLEDDPDEYVASFDDEKIFVEYWKEQVSKEFRCPVLHKLLNDILRADKESVYFEHPVDPERDECPDYFDVIARPICFRDIRKKIDRYDYADSFSQFQSDVELCFRNAMTYNSESHRVHMAARRLLTASRNLAREFKSNQLYQAKMRFARASAKPNSAVAALVDQHNRLRFQKSLIPSSGTLLVVPSVLMEHWQDQLRMHVDLAYCTTKTPIVFEYTGMTNCGIQVEEIIRQCMVENSHTPFAFIDKTGTKSLPSPEFLAMFSIIITTTQRFTNEWSHGSFQEELKRKLDDQPDVYFEDKVESCPLLKVNWLRMIVDEGHSMGRNSACSAIIFASWISADRRWAMTGTPTRQTVSHSGLSGILKLMQYLQHGFFSRRLDGEATWRNLIARSWNYGYVASFARLQSLLTTLMVRHTKLDIEELPPPRYVTTVLPMSFEEVTTYNTLVCAVQSNLLITSMQGKTSGAQDSLLHASQTAYARRALQNIRLVCCGGTRVVPTLSSEFWTEFVDDLKVFKPEEDKMKEVLQYLSRAVSEELSPCGCCGLMLSTLLVFPCADLVCTECVDKSSTSCLVCDKEFNVDDFQRLQPGMDYQWLHNIEEETKKRKMKPVPAAVDDQRNPVSNELLGQNVVLPNGAGQLSPLNVARRRRRSRKPGDGHMCEYDPKSTNGECVLCWKEHDSCNLMNKTCRCDVCHRRAETCPRSESKSFYIVDRLLKLYELQQQQETRRSSLAASTLIGEDIPLDKARPLKVIVFSQFRKVLNLIGDRLIRRFGTACVAEYWGKFRRQELHKFVYADECFCMLLGKDGSEGLDLSFVTHIIFLEQVWDKSLENQAVARAWRMGAKGTVEVEILIAENSVEETMRTLERSLEQHQADQDAMTTDDVQGVWSASDSGKAEEYQRAKLHFLLKGLELIKNQCSSSFGSQKRKATIPTYCNEECTSSEQKKSKRKRVRFDV